MSKKAIFFLVGGLIILSSAIFFLIFRYRDRTPDEPVRAIPEDASAIVKVNNIKELISDFKENDVWNELSDIKTFAKTNLQLNYIDSLMHLNSDIRSLISDHPFYISLHSVGNARTGYLFVFFVPKGLNEKKITDIIKIQVEESGTITSRKYEGTNIYDIRLLNKETIKNFSYAVTGGFLLLSFTPILIEDAVRQLTLEESFAKNADFRKILGTTGKNVTANVFINYQHFPVLLASMLKNGFGSKIQTYDDFAGWTALDLNMQEESVLLNGFTIVNDSAKQLFRLFSGQAPGRTTIDNILPSSVSAFLVINLSDEKKFLKIFRQQLQEKGKLNEYNRNTSQLKNTYNLDINDVFYSQLEGEIALAFESTQSEKNVPGRFVILKTKSKNQAERALADAIHKIASKKGIPVSRYLFSYNFDNELSFTIYQLPLENFLKKYLGNFFNCSAESYFTFIDNYLVFGNTVKSLTEFIHSNVLNRTLTTDLAYREYKNNISPKATVNFYSDLSRAPLSFSEYLIPEILTGWENNIRVFQKLQIFGFQLSTQKELIYTNFYLKSLSEYKDKPHTVWESLLDTTFEMKPQFVINHNTRQTEIFLQDNNNTIYLINQVGRILWKLNLTEKIKSEIYQIDYYSNGKLQFLFSTGNYLHLIDRNGNYVERYPVKLRSTATNGMALFDYDKNRDYRIFIAGEDHKVYAYDKAGDLVSGWKFSHSESTVNQPVRHFRVGTRDYIVFGDKLRTYILDRKGNDRVHVNELIPRSQNNDYQIEEGDNSQKAFIVFSDTAGTVNKIFFDGHIERFMLSDYTAGHFFDFKDVDGDGQKDFIFLDQNKLTVFKSNKSKLFDYDFDFVINLPPVCYHFAATDRKIGVVSRDRGLVYLINNDGTLYKGFPLKGNTLFSIGYLGNTISHFNLVVGGDDNFLYNYIVQ